MTPESKSERLSPSLMTGPEPMRAFAICRGPSFKGDRSVLRADIIFKEGSEGPFKANFFGSGEERKEILTLFSIEPS